jgi:pimeloyl-ACP methyl ester carboxylesterase
MRLGVLPRLLLALTVAVALNVVPAAPAEASSTVVGPCHQGALPHGALSLTCVPTTGWNGDVVIFAHGYVPSTAPLGFYNLDIAAGVYLPNLVQSLGFAFATTSYRQNGIAILEGLDDIRELVAAFSASAPRPPARAFLVGGSEGALVTTLLLERSPLLFAGGIAACGPIGSFRGQIDYIGDFRVLFDVFFPGVLPGTAVNIPAELIQNWETIYVPRIKTAVAANPVAIVSLLRMTKAAIDPADPSTVAATTVHLLWYSVLGTNDARSKLGGNPYGNVARRYSGSGSHLLDAIVNALAFRVAPAQTALVAMRNYETTGALTRPLIAPHTTGDEIIPIWHESLYFAKLAPGARFVPMPIDRYGHCRFTPQELVTAFALLLLQTSSP